MSAESIEYEWIDGVERLELYEPGGYHPIMIDDVLHSRYRIVDKLGFGGYSTVWLGHDARLNRYVAIKVGISGATIPQQESSTLRALSESSVISPLIDKPTSIAANDVLPSILDEFDVRGPNGTHKCYAVDPAQGNLKESLFNRLFPIHVARALAAKLAIAVAFVHSKGFIHGDLHLRNVLVKLPLSFNKLSIPQLREKFGKPETVPIRRVDGKPLSPCVPSQAVTSLYLGKEAPDFTIEDARGLILCDFGESFNPIKETRLGKNCNTPTAMKAPEALFEPEAALSYSSDIWSLGTAIWEILGMKFIFSESEPEDEIIAQQIDVLGYHDFPEKWREQWERPGLEETDSGRTIPCRPAGERETWPPLERAFEEFVQKYRRKREATGVFGDDETRAILDLVRAMLKFRPEERLDIQAVLGSEWMVKWALPSLQQEERSILEDQHEESEKQY
ncbi:hypothetical protein HIM_00837 [Hirsutella minnesotensis 3608]|nr:hypothetical protein HIM_00837 [Hirsutella minnesotensis 3608]